MSETALWKPSASIETLKQRAKFIQSIRQFFAQRDVLEVDTPLLSHGTVTDVHLDAFQTDFYHDDSGETVPLFLQTSPEFAMKRLLSAGSGPIYQICKAFRNESAGRFHNPEFTMLEWYRPGFDEHQLMAEMKELLITLFGDLQPIKVSYQQAFLNALNIDPLTASLSQLKEVILAHSPNDDWVHQEDNKDTLLQWIFSILIEPTLGLESSTSLHETTKAQRWQPCFVYDFPASQAALARINQQDSRVAHRFELYFKGVELANGYYELQGAAEQISRFEQDNMQRRQMGKSEKAIDQQFIQALQHGLPDCAGVALGIDRLFLLQQGTSELKSVLSFDYQRC